MSTNPPTMKITISLPGVLHRAADRLKKTRDMKHLEYMLRQLYTHLDYLRSKKDSPDALETLNQFFEVWVD